MNKFILWFLFALALPALAQEPAPAEPPTTGSPAEVVPAEVSAPAPVTPVLPPPAEEATGSEVEEPTLEIFRFRKSLATSFNKGDINGVVNLLDPNVVATWQNGEVCRGPAAVRSFYHRMVEGEERAFREVRVLPDVTGQHIEGDTAVLWGNLHDRLVLTDGGELEFHSVFTATLAKRGDRWLATSFHASVNVFDNPPFSRAIRKTGLWFGIGGTVAGVLAGFILARMSRGPQRSTWKRG